MSRRSGSTKTRASTDAGLQAPCATPDTTRSTATWRRTRRPAATSTTSPAPIRRRQTMQRCCRVRRSPPCCGFVSPRRARHPHMTMVPESCSQAARGIGRFTAGFGVSPKDLHAHRRPSQKLILWLSAASSRAVCRTSPARWAIVLPTRNPSLPDPQRPQCKRR